MTIDALVTFHPGSLAIHGVTMATTRQPSVLDTDLAPAALHGRIEKWKTLDTPVATARAELAATLRNED